MVQQMGTRKVVSEGYSIKHQKNSQENKTVKLHQYCFIISEAVIFLANLKLQALKTYWDIIAIVQVAVLIIIIFYLKHDISDLTKSLPFPFKAFMRVRRLIFVKGYYFCIKKKNKSYSL